LEKKKSSNLIISHYISIVQVHQRLMYYDVFENAFLGVVLRQVAGFGFVSGF
jgi:hypothetical protein